MDADATFIDVARQALIRLYAWSMIRSRIHLIGGGPGTMLSLRRHLRSALSLASPTKKPLVAYVGAASGDHPGFQQMIGAVIALAGGRLKPVKLASPRAKVSAAQGLLEDCDVVFVSGGDVDAGMNVLHERGVMPVFDALARDGRPMIGISAGSIMLGRAWVRFPEADAPGTSKDAATPEVFPCMGLAPVYVDAHAEDDEWGELRVLLHVLGAAAGEAAVGYGLTRKGGLCVDQGKEGAIVTPFGTDAPRFVLKGRVAVAATPLALGGSEAVAPVKSPPRRRAPLR
jgi:peptidase E